MHFPPLLQFGIHSAAKQMEPSRFLVFTDIGYIHVYIFVSILPAYKKSFKKLINIVY